MIILASYRQMKHGTMVTIALMIACASVVTPGSVTTAAPAPTKVHLESTPTPEPVSLSFEGTDDFLTPVFELREGMVILTLSHTGQSNFVVQIIGEDAEQAELSVNTIGNYSGTRAHQVQSGALVRLQPGNYRIQVQADGQWQVVLEQPSFPDAESPPLEFTGVGHMVHGPILLSQGTTPVHITHQGQSNFVVEVYSTDGKRSELLVNTIGDYDGSLAVQAEEEALLGLEPGPHIVVIQADGPWSVKLGE